MPPAAMPPAGWYPAALEIDCPDRELDRLTSLPRPIVFIPVGILLALPRDEYPSTDEEQAVHLDLWYPQAMELNRWLPLVKWFLAIPHYIVLAFLWIAAVLCVVAAWIAILLARRYPRGLFEFVVGVFRWTPGVGLRLPADNRPLPAIHASGFGSFASLRMTM